MLEFGELDSLSAANDPCESGAEVLPHPQVAWVQKMVKQAFAECDLAWAFLSLDRLKEVKQYQLGILFGNSSFGSREALLARARRLLFRGLGEGVEKGAYDASFLESYNAWAVKLLNFLRSSPDPLPQALTVFDRNSASLEFEFEHGAEQLFGTVQRDAIRRILFFLRQNRSVASQDPNIIFHFLADYFDDHFLPLFESLSELAFSYAESLRLPWFEWCGKVVPLVYDWIDGDDASGLDVLRCRLQLSLVL